MNWVYCFVQALTVWAVVGQGDLVESNRVECADDFNLEGAQSFYFEQFPTKLGKLISCRPRATMVELNPTHEVLEGVDVVWQIPPNPKAVLLLIHSANGTPFSYWPSHPNAPKCEGTPEHVVATRQALVRGFATIAVKSAGDEWEAWPTASSVDIQNVVKILKAWTTEHGLQDLPLSAWGTSIGGDFVSSLATAVKMHSLIVMISKGNSEAFDSALVGKYPPTLFVPMIKDERTLAKVKENVEVLRAKGIPCDIEGAPPLKVHPHFFAEFIDDLDEEQSARLHSVFVEDGIVAEDNSMNKVLMQHEVEPYLRKAGILPAKEDFQHQQDEETLNGAKEEGSKPAGGRGGQQGGRGGRGGGPGLPPSARGEGPPAGGRGGGPRLPPSVRGEGPPGGGRGGGRGPKLGGGRPAAHPLASGVSNQLMVAEGKHTLTSRHNSKVFAWLEGEGWSSAQSQ